MTKFFSKLRYSFGNEDWRAEQEALKIRPNDRVLCITASGDRPLNLLATDCKQIVTVDANPVQNHLLQIKIAAMKGLDNEAYLEFLGASPNLYRLKTLKDLTPHMDPSAAVYWMNHYRMIEKGILYQGSVERLTHTLSKLFRLMWGKKLKRLFAFDDIEEQRKFLKEEWSGRSLRMLLNGALNTFLSRMLIKDPGLANYSCTIKPGDYIYERMMASLERDLAKNNLLLSLLLRGRVLPEAFSPYLTKEGIQSIKPRLSSLEIHTCNILDYLESLGESKFDVFSLSDIVSYLSYPDFVRLLKGIVKAANPGARFCLRQFMSAHDIPPSLRPYFLRDKALEKHLEKLDNCFVYRFIVGTVDPQPNKDVEKYEEEINYRLSNV